MTPATWRHLARVLAAFAFASCAAVAPAQPQPWNSSTDGLAPIPPLRARVTDLTQTLSTADVQALDAKLAAWEQKTGNQLAVLLVPTTQPEPIEAYSIRVAEAWKIGRKGQDNGALLLLAKNDKKLRIEVGYGLEGVLTDVTSRRIIADTMAPLLRQNQFAQGIEAGVDQIIAVVDKGEPLAAKPAGKPQSRGGGFPIEMMLIIVFVVVPDPGRHPAAHLRPRARLDRRRRHRRRGRVGGGGVAAHRDHRRGRGAARDAVRRRRHRPYAARRRRVDADRGLGRRRRIGRRRRRLLGRRRRLRRRRRVGRMGLTMGTRAISRWRRLWRHARHRSRRRASRVSARGDGARRERDRRRRAAGMRGRCASRSRLRCRAARVWQAGDAARARARGVRAAARVGHRAQRRRAGLSAAGGSRRRDRRRPRHPCARWAMRRGKRSAGRWRPRFAPGATRKAWPRASPPFRISSRGIRRATARDRNELSDKPIIL